jgi:hypothetical protein
LALLSRILVILFGFLAACLTAGVVVTVGVLVREWDDLTAFADPHTAWWIAAFFTFVVSGVGVIPALLAIAAAEWFCVRSVLAYAAAGGLGLVALYYGFGFADRMAAPLAGREVEIMAGAGIAAGFVYWAIAGRRAGAWREVSSSRDTGAVR